MQRISINSESKEKSGGYEVYEKESIYFGVHAIDAAPTIADFV